MKSSLMILPLEAHFLFEAGAIAARDFRGVGLTEARIVTHPILLTEVGGYELIAGPAGLQHSKSLEAFVLLLDDGIPTVLIDDLIVLGDRVLRICLKRHGY